MTSCSAAPAPRRFTAVRRRRGARTATHTAGLARLLVSRIKLPSGRSTRRHSRKASTGATRCSTTKLAYTRSKEPSVNGSGRHRSATTNSSSASFARPASVSRSTPTSRAMRWRYPPSLVVRPQPASSTTAPGPSRRTSSSRRFSAATCEVSTLPPGRDLGTSLPRSTFPQEASPVNGRRWRRQTSAPAPPRGGVVRARRRCPGAPGGTLTIAATSGEPRHESDTIGADADRVGPARASLDSAAPDAGSEDVRPRRQLRRERGTGDGRSTYIQAATKGPIR